MRLPADDMLIRMMSVKMPGMSSKIYSVILHMRVVMTADSYSAFFEQP